MNEKKITFISCANNMQYYEECVHYIRNLKIPEGYELETVCIQEADSMAQGYNAGMKSSDAKYKVYLHQDTFLLNQNFIYDILNIFESDESIGMIGVLGRRELPDDADCYIWDTGGTYAYNGLTVLNLRYYQDKKKKYIPVKAVDGLLMATQVDLPWREDFLDGWDFYDVSQAIEMSRKGYQTVVPCQEINWCHHDCGVSKLINYHYYRHKMIKEYSEYFREKDVHTVFDMEKQRQMEKIRSGLTALLEVKAFDECCRIAGQIQGLLLEDTQIREIVNLMEIYSLERGGISSEWWTLSGWERLYEYYTWVRFAVLRARFQGDSAEIEELLNKGKVSQSAFEFLYTL